MDQGALLASQKSSLVISVAFYKFSSQVGYMSDYILNTSEFLYLVPNNYTSLSFYNLVNFICYMFIYKTAYLTKIPFCFGQQYEIQPPQSLYNVLSTLKCQNPGDHVLIHQKLLFYF